MLTQPLLQRLSHERRHHPWVRTGRPVTRPRVPGKTQTVQTKSCATARFTAHLKFPSCVAQVAQIPISPTGSKPSTPRQRCVGQHLFCPNGVVMDLLTDLAKQ